MGTEDGRRQISEARQLTEQLPVAEAQAHLDKVVSDRLEALVQEAIAVVEVLQEAVPLLERDARTTYSNSKKAEERLMAAVGDDPDTFFIANSNHELSQHAARAQTLTFNLLYFLGSTLTALHSAQSAAAQYRQNVTVIADRLAAAAAARKAALEQTKDYLRNMEK
jgi:hypothetical protein